MLPVSMGLLLTPAPCLAAETDGEAGWAEKTLQEAGLKTDVPALLKFFERRTLSNRQRRKLADVVALLGHPSYAVRRNAYQQLRQAGMPALVHLKAALANPDLEIARSAEKLVTIIESGSDANLIVAAARVLAVRKPAGAARTLLAYLPMISDDYIAEVIHCALAAVALTDGKPDPLLTAALQDREPARRAAAAFVYAQAGSEHRKSLSRLLADTDVRVRFHAAQALVQAGEKAAVAPLIDVLASGPSNLAWQSEELLLRIAGEKPPPISLGNSPTDRRQCRDKWAAWWQTNQNTVNLAKIDFKNSQRGLTLACDCDSGKGTGGYLWELGRDGKERWHFDGVRVVVDVQLLRGGNMLLAEGDAYQVTERTRAGKILWSHKTSGYATTVQRLPNGNTLLAGYNEITVVTRSGKVVFAYRGNGGTIYRVQRQRNGNLVFAQNGQVVETDKAGKQLRTIGIPGGTGIWTHVEKLNNGRFLVAQYSANKVMELDAAGKVHWEATVTSPSSASRLPNGNTLVSAMNDRKVMELNRAGKEVWSQKTKGRPFLVRRY
jgi:HEAT repeat protein